MSRLVGGRYELGEEIGRGGMAQVHAAYDTRLGRRVAIKMLHAGRVGDRIFIARFRREAQAAASLAHPNIVAVFDSGEDIVETTNGTEVVPYIVMELVEGRTLSQLMHDDGDFTIDQALMVTEGVLQALGYSHAHGVVHRDIKPGNVMLTRDGAVKVMDFGIARGGAGDSTATMTQTQSVVGTAQYLSPEQARGLDVDGRSDLYSAGCLLFELVTGRPPFVGDSPLAIAYQHVGEDPATPSTYNPAINQDLDAVILHALIKDRERRYQNADAFIADVRAVRAGHPLSPAARATSEAAFTPTQSIAPAAVPEPVPAEPAPAQPTGPVTGPMPVVAPERRRNRLAWLLPLLLVLAAIGTALWWFNRPAAVVTKPVPNLISLNKAQAEAALKANGLTGKFTAAPNDKPKDTVYGQSPAPGTMLDEKVQVAVQLSLGPATVTVPDVRGMKVSSARVSLEALGLFKAGEQEVDSATVPQGSVVRTDPDTGRAVPAGSGITLYVSSGKITVPDVVGQSKDDAAAVIQKAGLRVGYEVQRTAQADAGTVLSQDPKGTSVPPGTKVTLVIAAPIVPTTVYVTTTTTVPAPDPTTPAPDPTTANPQPSTTRTPHRPRPSETVTPTTDTGPDPDSTDSTPTPQATPTG